MGIFAGLWAGFTLGLLGDCASLTLFGAQAFALTTVGYFCGFLKSMVDEDSVAAQMMITSLMYLLYSAVIFFMEALFSDGVWHFGFQVFVGQFFYTALISPVFLWVLLIWKILFEWVQVGKNNFNELK